MCFSCAAAYDRMVSPYIVHAGCSLGAFARMRQRIVPQATGVVAEIGFGSGLNLPYYNAARVERLAAIDPDETMLSLARRKLAGQEVKVDLLPARGESLPLESGSIDTVVVTYALCTIPSPACALKEIKRVLKPSGRLLFCEHGRSVRPFCSRIQDRFNGLWGQLAGGCNLNRCPRQLIETAGFTVRNLQQEQFPLHLWHLGAHFTGEAELCAEIAEAGAPQTA